MKQDLIYFLKTYGNDFFHKLPKYKTARFMGVGIVSLVNFYPDSLTFDISLEGNSIENVCLFKLDEFVL